MAELRSWLRLPHRWKAKLAELAGAAPDEESASYGGGRACVCNHVPSADCSKGCYHNLLLLLAR